MSGRGDGVGISEPVKERDGSGSSYEESAKK